MRTRTFIILAAIMLVANAAAAQQEGIGVEYSETCRFYGFEIWGRDYAHVGAATQIGGVGVDVSSHISQGNDLDTWDTQVSYELNDYLSAAGGYLILPGGNEIKAISSTVRLPGAISPRYTIAHIEQGKADNGQFHVFGIDISPGDATPDEISANLMIEAVYNDGVNPFSEKAIRGFTHTTAGLAVDVPLGDIVFQPGVLWQHTFDNAVSGQRNEVWYTAALQYRF
jgi:hypothetical protein